MEPASEFSMAATPASTSPLAMASKILRQLGTATGDGSAKNRSTASSLNAPGSP